MLLQSKCTIWKTSISSHLPKWLLIKAVCNLKLQKENGAIQLWHYYTISKYSCQSISYQYIKGMFHLPLLTISNRFLFKIIIVLRFFCLCLSWNWSLSSESPLQNWPLVSPNSGMEEWEKCPIFGTTWASKKKANKCGCRLLENMDKVKECQNIPK